MMKLEETKYPNVVYIEVDGKVTEEDAEKSEAFIKEHYGNEKKLNAMVYIKDMEGTDLGGILKGSLIDIKHWEQYGKFALIANPAWIEGGAAVADVMPGIEVRQFDRAQIDEAWEWLQK
ncbi:STAS/SEC14 domain-containing protein [Salinicoccus roseus]|uniref:STAS/SEC14 domain-containing protein n=1 Tax=Salinicoccus roseus TaxID=45670 RepID=UPI0023004679|nr:STAS/SEC14 domain-containing protein [Salinicoccus roseus]